MRKLNSARLFALLVVTLITTATFAVASLNGCAAKADEPIDCCQCHDGSQGICDDYARYEWHQALNDIH